jgi:hypothetical protein
MGTQTHITTLYHGFSSAREERSLELRLRGSRFELVECSKGPDTQLVFGDDQHTNVLTFGRETAAQLCAALDVASLDDALDRMLAQIDVPWLSDIQDMFDRLGLPYVRSSFGPGGLSYMPLLYDGVSG